LFSKKPLGLFSAVPLGNSETMEEEGWSDFANVFLDRWILFLENRDKDEKDEFPMSIITKVRFIQIC